jgi:hypothetical protein
LSKNSVLYGNRNRINGTRGATITRKESADKRNRKTDNDTSQNVRAELRSGDIEKICTVLDEYELQLAQACSVLPSNPIIETLSQISPQR